MSRLGKKEKNKLINKFASLYYKDKHNKLLNEFDSDDETEHFLFSVFCNVPVFIGGTPEAIGYIGEELADSDMSPFDKRYKELVKSLRRIEKGEKSNRFEIFWERKNSLIGVLGHYQVCPISVSTLSALQECLEIAVSDYLPDYKGEV